MKRGIETEKERKKEKETVNLKLYAYHSWQGIDSSYDKQSLFL